MNEQLPIAWPSNHPALPERAERVRNLVNTARVCILEIGRELIAAKAEVPHGEWLAWLEAEFGWTVRTADKYMHVAGAFKLEPGSNFDGITIDATALYALAATDVPQTARDEAVLLAELGEHVTKADADRLIADAMRTERVKFEEAVTQIRAEAHERTSRAVADATERLAENNEALAAEIKRIRDAETKPDVEALVSQLCKATGRKKLRPEQLQHLAFILGVGVTDGKRVYPPATKEEAAEAEANLRVSGPALRALEYFPGAPAPDEVRHSLRPAQVESARRNAERASGWLAEFSGLLRGE
ncbi:MAG TPA: DUF3102 domain-containing protein [Acetobacteraceae bacterium]|jgi:hypothetical protein